MFTYTLIFPDGERTVVRGAPALIQVGQGVEHAGRFYTAINTFYSTTEDTTLVYVEEVAF